MSAAKKKSKKRDRKCPHCGSGQQTFRYMQKIYLFDIDLARGLVDDGRQPLELEPDDVRHSVDNCRIHPEHLDHVDPKYPGIVAHIWYPEPDGTILHGHVLIDGNHRAARCLRDGLPYYIHLLTEEESRQVLLKGPDCEAIVARLKAEPMPV